MKKYFKLQIFIPLAAITAAIALGIACNAIAAYTPGTAITDVTITSPNDGDNLFYRGTYNFTCTTSTDMDSNCGTPIADTVTHTWSGAEIWNPQTSTDVNWTAPNTPGDVSLTVTASDSPLYDDANKTDTITLTMQNFADFIDPNKISGGADHTLVIAKDNTLWACGRNYDGPLGINSTEDKWIINQVHDGNMDTDSGYLENIVTIEAGRVHSLAIDSNGRVWGWGNNGHGSVGDGHQSASDYELTPVPVVDGEMNTPSGYLENIVRIAASLGWYTSIARDSNGYVWAWGQNEYGQLGNGKNNSDYSPNWPGEWVPVHVVDGEMNTDSNYLENIVDVDAGGYHSIALGTNGHVWTWGRNYYGELGNNTQIESKTPVHVHDGAMNTDSNYLENIEAISSGRESCYTLDANGHVWAWGSDQCGQLGYGSQGDSSVPIQVQDGEMNTSSGYLEYIVDISAGIVHVLALDANSNVWAWGLNVNGQLGNGQGGWGGNSYSDTPVRVKNTEGTGYLTDIVYIDAGGSHSLAIDANGTGYSWGRNYHGQLGINSQYDANTPQLML